MRLYDFTPAPNPRRVRIFLAEKNIQVETVQVNLRGGEHFADAFKTKVPQLIVPSLELDDGTILTESMAICRYFEALQPQPALFGSSPREIGTIEMWNRRVELEGILATADALRNSAERMKGRAVTGPVNYPQIPALAERGKARAAAFFEVLNNRLGRSTYLAGEAYSVADINALVMVDFSAWVAVKPTAGQQNLARWYQLVTARPSAKA
jgi:glutathione S-transferase